MRIDTLSTFPHMYDSVMGESIMKRAQASGALDFHAHEAFLGRAGVGVFGHGFAVEQCRERHDFRTRLHAVLCFFDCLQQQNLEGFVDLGNAELVALNVAVSHGLLLSVARERACWESQCAFGVLQIVPNHSKTRLSSCDIATFRLKTHVA